MSRDGLVVSIQHTFVSKVADVAATEVDGYLSALEAIGENLDYELVNGKGPRDPSRRDASEGNVVLWIFGIGAAAPALAILRTRLRRRSFQRRAAYGPGELASNPIAIERVDELAGAGALTRCSCGGRRAPAVADAAPEEIRLGELDLLWARFVCRRCSAAQALYVRPAAQPSSADRRIA